MAVHEHRHHAKGIGPIRCRILVVSDTKTDATDESGKLARDILEKAGHQIVFRKIVSNDRSALEREIGDHLAGADDLLMTIGGTGISKRDISVDTVKRAIEKEIEGFGEIFRTMSFREIGTAAMMSRALLGVAGGKVLLCTPGSPAAVKLALEEILLKELPHIVWELRK